MEIVSFREAKTLQLTQYCTGKPCKYGHLCNRLVSNRSCLKCCSIKTREKYSKNPEKYRRVQRAYYAKTIDDRRAYLKRKRSENPEKYREFQRKSYWKNVEKRRACEAAKNRKINDLLDVLRQTKPELLKEFGL